MDFLDKIIKQIGTQNVIIGGSVLLAVILIIVGYRFLKLKMYRKEVVEIENQLNAIKTLPIQYRLGRVQGIGKNMPGVMEKYNEYDKEFMDLIASLNNSITPLFTEVDEQLFYRKLSGVNKKLIDLKEKVADYEKHSKELLSKIEVITEVENIQRLEIIRIKEKYRLAGDTFAAVRFKIEDFVPAIPVCFEDIDERFVKLEDMMNNQRFDDAKEYTFKIGKDVDLLSANLRDLPTYISIVRKYIPKRLEELGATIIKLKENNFSIEKLDATSRYNKISQDLESTIRAIKQLRLENVGTSIENMTEELNQLTSDFEKEENAFSHYEETRNNCYNHIEKLDEGLKHGVATIDSLAERYLLNKYDITIKRDYIDFKDILDDLVEMTKVIESKNFSFSVVNQQLEDLIKRCVPFDEALTKYNELENSLHLEEKRALDELDNIDIVLLEIKSEIKNKHLPMINESYKDYIDDSYQKAQEIEKFMTHHPIDLQRLSQQVDAARDIIYKLYDNVHNLIVTAEMVEEAIIYGNRHRSSFLEVNTELAKAELLFRNGEYTKALTTAVDIIEKINPGSYEMLINKNNAKSV